MSLRKAILTLCLVLVAMPASAVVMEKLGDPSLTVDTGTGLEWLDLTETVGRSYNDVEGDILLSSFRHATRDEVKTLFQNADFTFTSTYATGAASTANAPAAQLLLDVMGCTTGCGTATESGVGFADIDGNWTTRPKYTLSPHGGSAAVQSLATTNKDLTDATAGHYLVRESTPGPAPLPEPSAAVLFAVGSLIVASSTRRRGLR